MTLVSHVHLLPFFTTPLIIPVVGNSCGTLGLKVVDDMMLQALTSHKTFGHLDREVDVELHASEMIDAS